MISSITYQTIKSYIVSAALTLQSIIVALALVGYTDGALATPQSSLAYVQAHWWAAFLGVLLGAGPYHRALQGASNTAAANEVAANNQNPPVTIITPPPTN